jgi:hypothetical protein
MQAVIDIGFDELVQIARKLPRRQWTELKKEVEEKKLIDEDMDRKAFRDFLLSGPVFSKQQLKKIAETRKKINEWRTN